MHPMSHLGERGGTGYREQDLELEQDHKLEEQLGKKWNTN